MQQRSQTIIEADGSQAQAELEKLKQRAQQYREQLEAARKSPIGEPRLVKTLSNEYNKLVKEINRTKKETIDVSKVMNNLSGTTMRDLNRAYQKIKNQRLGMARDNPKYAQIVQTERLLKTEIDKVNMSLRTKRSLLSRVAQGFSRYSAIALGATASIAGLFMATRKAIDEANIREENLKYLQALTGLSEEVVETMGEMAIKTSTSAHESGVVIRQSADEIINAYTLIGSKRPELLQNAEALHMVTEEAIILSEAAKMQLEPAAAALAITLNQFRLEADQSRRVINALAAGSQAGAGDIEYIAQAIEKAGTTANLMGISVEQTVGAIETLAPFFSEASEAGNTLDKTLLLMRKHNIGYASGVFDLNDAINELEHRFANGETAVDLFGTRHAKAAELLVLGKDELIRYTEAVTGSNKAIEQATINTDTNAARIEQAKNRIKEIRIELGQKLQPVWASIISRGALLFKSISALVDIFIKYNHVIIPLVAAIAAYHAAMKINQLFEYAKGLNLVQTAYKLITGQVKIATVAQQAWNRVTSINPYVALAIAVAAITTAMFRFKNSIDAARISKRAYNDISKETENRMADEIVRVNALFDALENQNTTQEQRATLMNTINTQYGSYLDNLLTEETYLERIAIAREKIIAGLRKEIMLQVRREKAADIYKEMLDIEDKLKGEGVAWGSAVWSLLTPGSQPGGAASAYVENLTKRYGALKEVWDDLLNVITDDELTLAGKDTFDEDEDESKFTPKGDDKQKFDARRELWEEAQMQEAQSIDGSLAYYADYLLERKKWDQSYLDWKKQSAEARNAEEIAANKKLLDDTINDLRHQIWLEEFELKQKLVREQITQEEYDRDMLIIKMAHLLSEKFLLEEFGQDTIDIKKRIAEAELDIEEQKNRDLKLKRDEDLKNQADKAAKLAELMQSTASDIGESIGKILTDQTKSSQEKMREWSKEMLKILLTSLRNAMMAYIAETYFKEIATKGLAGIATGTIYAGLISGAYATAVGAIDGFEVGGFTPWVDAKKPVGVVHGKEYVIPEAGLLNPSLRGLINTIEHYRSSGQLRNINFKQLDAMPQFAVGGFTTPPPAAPSADTTTNYNQTNPELIQVIQKLNYVIDNLSNKVEHIEANISYDKHNKSMSDVENAKKLAKRA